MLWGTLQILGVMVLLLLTLAFILLFDRKVWAAVQMRKGPNVVGPFGLFQSFADFLKFVFKEIVIPAGANKTVFLLAPIITLTLALVGWAVIPVAPGWVSIVPVVWPDAVPPVMPEPAPVPLAAVPLPLRLSMS